MPQFLGLLKCSLDNWQPVVIKPGAIGITSRVGKFSSQNRGPVLRSMSTDCCEVKSKSQIGPQLLVKAHLQILDRRDRVLDSAQVRGILISFPSEHSIHSSWRHFSAFSPPLKAGMRMKFFPKMLPDSWGLSQGIISELVK